jgi:NAD-dependent deacetylase
MDVYEEAAGILAGTRRAVAFTGAGSSAESGIPTFRDPGGLWDRFDPGEFGTVEGIMGVFQREPDVIREFLLSTVDTFEKAKPNQGHYGLAELEKLGVLTTVITQNIDNLHTDAGNTDVLEVHGNMFRACCLSCGSRYPLDKAGLLKKAREMFSDKEKFGLATLVNLMPKCECGGMTRPDVVMFGEAVQQLHQCYKAAAGAEAMLVMGTSGVVYPAAALPHQAKEGGAKIIEINPTENSYRAITDIYIDEPSGEAMPKVLEHVRELVNK